MRYLVVILLFSVVLAAQVPSDFLGVHLNKVPSTTPFPSASPNAWRSLDSGTTWGQISLCDPTGATCPAFHSSPGKTGCTPNAKQPDDDTNCAYNWSALDVRLNDVIAGGVTTIILTMNKTPGWLAIRWGDTQCAPAGPDCSAPSDINTACTFTTSNDGVCPATANGTDAGFKNFATALAKRNVRLHPGKVTHYEIWNEPQNGWTVDTSTTQQGAYNHLAKMIADASTAIKAQDAAAKILLPGTGLQATALTWTNGILDAIHTAGNDAKYDVVPYHRYFSGAGAGNLTCVAGSHPQPVSQLPDWTQLVTGGTSISNFKTSINGHNASAKEIWYDEGGQALGGQSACSDQDAESGGVGTGSYMNDERAGFGQQVIFAASTGTKHFFYYAWDILGMQWKVYSGGACGAYGAGWSDDGNGCINRAGKSWAVIMPWLTGATFTNWNLSTGASGCLATGHLWNCVITKTGGYVAQFVFWDTWGGTTTFAPGLSYTGGTRRNMDGTTSTIADGTANITIANEPILLEASIIVPPPPTLFTIIKGGVTIKGGAKISK